MPAATILVVDDDPILRAIAGEILGSAGYRVIDAEDGSVGLRLLETTPVDLLITDMIMPEVEGVETIMAARRLKPGLPIIAISGGTRSQSAGNLLHLGEALGAEATLSKPLSPPVLLETVARLLSAAPAGGNVVALRR